LPTVGDAASAICPPAPCAIEPAGLASALANLIAPYEPERLVITGRHDYGSAANWKILTENQHEC
jgi:hypothetical protein